jgi:hypothetical protein
MDFSQMPMKSYLRPNHRRESANEEPQTAQDIRISYKNLRSSLNNISKISIREERNGAFSAAGKGSAFDQQESSLKS